MNEVERISKIIPANTAIKEQIAEEIDIIVHKLKFIPAKDRPKVKFIHQKEGLSTEIPQLINDCLTISGGVFTDSASEADVLIFLQEDGLIYPLLTKLLEENVLGESSAYKKNNIFIIQNRNFLSSDATDILSKMEILAEINQPKYFFYGREGTDWLKFDVL